MNDNKVRFGKRLKSAIYAHPYFCFVVVLICLKQLLTAKIPIFVIQNNIYDDQLMVKLAQSLLSGDWLGTYDNNTLVKGFMFPALIAITKNLGLSYISAMTFIYSMSCVLFVWVIKDIFKKGYSKYIIFTVLLFNPVSFACWTLQRVYRNGITMSQVLIIFACFFAMYIRRSKGIKNLIGWAVGAGAAVFSLWNTREDGIWIMPFVIVVTIVLIGSVILCAYSEYRKKNKKEAKIKSLAKCLNKKYVLKIAVMVMPLLLFWCGNQIICAINYAHYGIYAANELNESAFKDVMKSIYAVKPEEEIQWVSVPREKLNRIYENSETLNSIHDDLEEYMDAWANNDRTPGDGEVEDGWFFWALRDAVAQAGYYKDAKTANEFYSKVSEEIEEALDDGRLERQATMPSALMSPWREDYPSQLLKAFAKCVVLTTGYTDVETCLPVSSDNGTGEIHMYENIANQTALSDTVKIIGWYSPKDDVNYKINIIDNENTVLAEAQLCDSQDVYDACLDLGIENESMKKCRFPVEIKNYVPSEDSKLYIQVINTDTNVEIERIELTSLQKRTETEYGLYAVESLILPDGLFDIARKSVDRCNAVTLVYQKTGYICVGLGMISYFIMTVWLVAAYVKKKSKSIRDNYLMVWLFVTAIGLSLVVLLGGVSYNHIASCNSVFYMYLSGSYPLWIILWSVSVCFVSERFVSKKKKQ